ncbi:MAG: NAD(P)-dependent oxidoreductase [Acidimicrobiia bacterium]|nr:NAD(P)-dependent oxidoreductase [Acidimicrobiia bacterium]MDX2468012.1 NAD(P)-dependent oxidoreductase [Acidimicrobiia bacterium]
MGDQLGSISSRSGRSGVAQRGGLRMLIAGMHGFIGSHIAQAAQSAGVDVVGLSLEGDIEKSRRFHESIGLSSVVSIAGDATDADVLRAAIDRYEPDIFVNAVGVIRTPPTTRWLADYAVNYATAAATVDALAMTDSAEKPFVIWIGSQAEYGEATPPWTETTPAQPSSAYGASKQVASALILAGQRSKLFDSCVVRLPIVFGPGQAPTLIIASAICSALGGRKLPMTAGSQRRRFAYAPDIGSSVVALGRQGTSGSTPALMNFPASEPIEIRWVVQLLETLMPTMQVDLGALEYRPGEQLDAWPDCSLAESIGLTALTPLDQALAETVAWYQDNPWFAEDFAS